MILNRKWGAFRPGVVAALGALVLAVLLGACAGDNGAHRSCATSGKEGDVVGGGGCLDEMYREIYHPGRGTDFGA
jgi:hypothetical protein